MRKVFLISTVSEKCNLTLLNKRILFCKIKSTNVISLYSLPSTHLIFFSVNITISELKNKLNTKINMNNPTQSLKIQRLFQSTLPHNKYFNLPFPFNININDRGKSQHHYFTKDLVGISIKLTNIK